MRVEVYEAAPGGGTQLAGELVLEGGYIVPEPPCMLLNNLMATCVVPVKGGDLLTAGANPREWLEMLHTRLRSAYLWASPAK